MQLGTANLSPGSDLELQVTVRNTGLTPGPGDRPGVPGRPARRRDPAHPGARRVRDRGRGARRGSRRHAADPGPALRPVGAGRGRLGLAARPVHGGGRPVLTGPPAVRSGRVGLTRPGGAGPGPHPLRGTVPRGAASGGGPRGRADAPGACPRPGRTAGRGPVPVLAGGPGPSPLRRAPGPPSCLNAAVLTGWPRRPRSGDTGRHQRRDGGCGQRAVEHHHGPPATGQPWRHGPGKLGG